MDIYAQYYLLFKHQVGRKGSKITPIWVKKRNFGDLYHVAYYMGFTIKCGFFSHQTCLKSTIHTIGTKLQKFVGVPCPQPTFPSFWDFVQYSEAGTN